MIGRYIQRTYKSFASYKSISRRQLHRIREAESAADASECEDIEEKSSLHADFHTLMGHLSHQMSIFRCNFAYGNTL